MWAVTAAWLFSQTGLAACLNVPVMAHTIMTDASACVILAGRVNSVKQVKWPKLTYSIPFLTRSTYLLVILNVIPLAGSPYLLPTPSVLLIISWLWLECSLSLLFVCVCVCVCVRACVMFSSLHGTNQCIINVTIAVTIDVLLYQF